MPGTVLNAVFALFHLLFIMVLDNSVQQNFLQYRNVLEHSAVTECSRTSQRPTWQPQATCELVASAHFKCSWYDRGTEFLI